MTDERLQKLEEQAFAKVIWGESEQDVLDFLTSSAVPKTEAERIISESFRERRADVRKIGLSQIFTGLGLLIAGAGAAIAYWTLSHIIHLGIMAALIALAGFGLFRILKGISRVVAGNDKGSISDMEG